MSEPLHVDEAVHLSSGAKSIHLRIADTVIALTSDDPDLKLRVEGAAAKFLVEKTDPDVAVSAARRDLHADVKGEKLFDSGALWQLYRQDERYLFRFTSSSFGPRPYKVACFNSDFDSGEVCLNRRYFRSGKAVYPMQYPLDELLMLNLLAGGRGAEVHSCGVVDLSGEGYLFIGQSGAGKTTTARLWQKRNGVKVLSDDRIILRKHNDGILMHGTPWHGEADISCPSQARLAKVFFLRRGEKNELASVGRAQAAARLLACSFPPFHSPTGLDFTLSFFEEVANSVDCCELRFAPDDGAVEFVRKLTK